MDISPGGTVPYQGAAIPANHFAVHVEFLRAVFVPGKKVSIVGDRTVAGRNRGATVYGAAGGLGSIFCPPIFFVEPGVTMLRAPDGSQQVLGKVVIDMRNGNVWGFPTLSHEPYPIAGPSSNVPTSHPFLLGKFSLSDMEKK